MIFFDSNTNLPTWLKHIHIWTLLLSNCGILWKGSSPIRYCCCYHPCTIRWHSYHCFNPLPLSVFSKNSLIFPLNWHFLRAFVDSFQGCYKDGTELGTFDCRWFAVLMLLLRPLLLFIYALTLSMMFFAYAVIILVILLIAMVNIQPFKKAAVRYPSTDPIFLVLLSTVYITALARGVADTKHASYYIAMSAITFLSAFVPIFYIIFFTTFWLISKRRWVHLLVTRLKFQ